MGTRSLWCSVGSGAQGVRTGMCTLGRAGTEPMVWRRLCTWSGWPRRPEGEEPTYQREPECRRVPRQYRPFDPRDVHLQSVSVKRQSQQEAAAKKLREKQNWGNGF